MAIRIPVTLVIEMDDGQQAEYVRYAGLDAPVRARDIVRDVRAYVLSAVADSAGFGISSGTRGADVSIKER
jgi:hypothetical protein